MKVLVTGGAGFIGSNLCERLLADPTIEQVRVIDDLSTGFAENLSGLGVEFHEASILDVGALERASSGCDAIVHLAALGSVPRSIENPMATHDANATGTLNVLQAARRVGNAHVVLASSSSVYGANPRLPKSEDMLCQPMSPYAVTKLATEQYAMAFAKVYDLPVLPFRFFNVYGPKQRAGHVYAAVIPVFVDAAVRGVPLPVNGDGQQSRDFTYVGTVVDVLATAVTAQVTGGPTNLAFGSRTSLLDLIALIEQGIGRSVEVEHRPARTGDVPHSQADNSVLRGLFPSLDPVPLEEGVRATIAWMEQTLQV
ncbi:NAD-dependent epimerase/dehydratase family protein [Nocardioides sp.]|uniref:NAD-dependent epimerase/dehydratase family protein n=1 Tax=Nocardioides sp. TaxID=35761 RepID=UPI00356585FA